MWEVYEVLNDPRRNYHIHCFHCHERFVLPQKKSLTKMAETDDSN
jgi:hypothetical protein